MDNSEFVFTQSTDENGNKIFIGGGYKINSYFLKAGQPIMATFNNNEEDFFDEEQKGGKKITTPFESLAVPAGLFYVNQKIAKPSNTPETHYNDSSHDMLPEDIHDKLLALVNPYQTKKIHKKTRKHIEKEKNETIEKVHKKRKTRRHLTK